MKRIFVLAAALLVTLSAYAYEVEVRLNWTPPTTYSTGEALLPEEIESTICQFRQTGGAWQYFGTEPNGGDAASMVRTIDAEPGEIEFQCQVALVDGKTSSMSNVSPPLTVPELDKGDPNPPTGLEAFLE